MAYHTYIYIYICEERAGVLLIPFTLADSDIGCSIHTEYMYETE